MEVVRTSQSTLQFYSDRVIKFYNPNHPFFDKKYFENEVKNISALLGNDNFVDCRFIDFDIFCYQMPRYDFALGDASSINYHSLMRVLFSLGIKELDSNLNEIEDALCSFGIQHRDVNPGNLLYCEKTRRIMLTDFFWSKNGEDSEHFNLPKPCPTHPWEVNHIYGNDDTQAFAKIKAQIYRFYLKEFSVRRDEIVSDFVEEIGTGHYRDGSSVFKGYSYHIVDLPEVTIQAHKSTCVNEYSIIKNSLPIDPKSFCDIGAANGYFSFNFLRDFNIKYGHAYEADERSSKFLERLTRLYKLEELRICGAFTEDTPFTTWDVVIFLNSHMWIYKQLGKEKTLGRVRNLLNSCKYMYFQTCGAYSSGMYKVEEYKTPKHIENMLFNAGAKDVRLVGEFIGSHDAPRHMFLVKGCL